VGSPNPALPSPTQPTLPAVAPPAFLKPSTSMVPHCTSGMPGMMPAQYPGRPCQQYMYRSPNLQYTKGATCCLAEVAALTDLWRCKVPHSESQLYMPAPLPVGRKCQLGSLTAFASLESVVRLWAKPLLFCQSEALALIRLHGPQEEVVRA
jgi:hypothetical protein